MNDPQPILTVRRAAVDFALGVLVFVVVAGSVAVTEGQASSGAASGNWVTTVAYASEPAAWARVGNWHLGATAVLALTCGALTAFNLSLARHVRTVAAPVKARSSA